MMLLSETEIKTHLPALKNSSLEASPISHHPNTGTHSISPYRSNTNGPGSNSEPSSHSIDSPPPDSTIPENNGSTNGKNPQNEEPPSPPPPNEEGFGPVLKNRNFLALWSGQVFSQLADKIYLVLMIALIATRFQASGQTISSWVSAIMIAFTIPAVLLGSLAGAFVDRWPKKAVLVATNLLRGFLVLSLPVLLWLCEGKQLAALPLGFCAMLGVTFLVSTLTQFFAPAEQSAIPLIVERRQLLAANSLYTTTMMASVIVGFAVGEPLLALADSFLGHLAIGKEIVVGGSYCIAGLLLLMLKTGENITPQQGEYPHVFEDIRDGLRYLKANVRVRNALIQLVILFSIFAALAVLAVRLAEVIPGMKASQFGFLMAAGGVGMAAGSTALGYFGSRFSHLQLSVAGSFGMAASLLGLSLFAQELVTTLLLVAFLGAFGAIVGVPMQTTVQADTPEEMRGKVFGLQNNAINIALSLPLALAGVAETFFGLKVVFLGLAALALGGGVLTWYISRYGNSPNHQS
ncbi:MFS transporter [Ancylothrix sp. C2]|uniref:MFS transporter n=1 Tax=Ancylothrix sp. D3o TaxID=2953691 RepID=UPI0021BAE78D|nr:MFS transporter [Ancylothrix sp. D3o]MCT7949277.1 MFS transporter [Ancylothrix sp. D3o]